MKEVKVFAPATIANVACGFDILGFAIDRPGDEVVARFTNRKGLVITQITGTKGKKLPFEVEKNTAGYAALQLLKNIGEEERGIELEIHKKMPFGSGLGSSAASAVGGVMAVNELLDCPLSKGEILRFAVEGEQIADGAFHADNVAPSLFGGITLIRNNQDLDVHFLPVPEKLHAVVVHPKIEILTKDARAVLSKEVELKKSIEQSGNLGGLIVGLYNNDLELISRSLKDVIIEPQRAVLIPDFYRVKEAAINAGALGCSISGAGPSIFALCTSQTTAQNIGAAIQKVFMDNNVNSECFSSPINQKGAIKLN
ncbi:MAG: homoserine kinase [Bacteroidota bacterium]